VQASLKPGSSIVINYVHSGAARDATLTVGTKTSYCYRTNENGQAMCTSLVLASRV
jgi:hypothetical protein